MESKKETIIPITCTVTGMFWKDGEAYTLMQGEEDNAVYLAPERTCHYEDGHIWFDSSEAPFKRYENPAFFHLLGGSTVASLEDCLEKRYYGGYEAFRDAIAAYEELEREGFSFERFLARGTVLSPVTLEKAVRNTRIREAG